MERGKCKTCQWCNGWYNHIAVCEIHFPYRDVDDCPERPSQNGVSFNQGQLSMMGKWWNSHHIQGMVIAMDKGIMKKIIGAAEEHPTDFVRRVYSEEEKNELVQFLRKGELCGVGDFVNDCVTGAKTSLEDVAYRKDGYLWTTAELYHIEKYNAAVTDDFLQHVITEAREKNPERPSNNGVSFNFNLE